MRRIERPAKQTEAQPLFGRRSGYRCRRRRSADAHDFPVCGIRLAHRVTKVASVILVADRRVRLMQSQIGVTSNLRGRMELDDILEVDDRRVVRLALEVMDSSPVILFRKPLVELRTFPY